MSLSSTPSSRSHRLYSDSILLVSVGLFFVSARWFTRKERQRRELGLWGANTKHRDSDIGNGNQQQHRTDDVIGSRGVTALQEVPHAPYLQHFYHCLHNACDPVRNPAGYIGMCVAENKLVLDIVAERLMQIGTATAAFSDSTVYCYNSFLGIPVARDAAAYFLAKRFLFPPDAQLTPEAALYHVNPQHVALGSGCSALLHYLFFILGEPGNCCLIPAPYYAAFDVDMKTIAGCVPYGFQMANPTLGPTEQDLSLAYIQAMSKGFTPKFVLLTNPNNPLGVVYSPRVIRNAIQWARKRNMHTIVDEIHALSAFHVRTTPASSNPHHTSRLPHQPQATNAKDGFQSVLRILNNELGHDVHMVWALSKDFGASGLRVGILYSQNERFMKALIASNICKFSCVSGPIQYVVSELLTDDVFVDRFLEESRERLQHSHEICVLKLEEMVVPFVPAEAGLFVYVDFSSLLPQKTFAWEEKLSELIFRYARVVLTPGKSMQEQSPGMFRICYAWVQPDVLEIAMERLSRLVQKVRRMDWDDLNEKTLSGIL